MHQKTPFEAGIFMLPVMVASGFSGPDCRPAGVAAWAARGGDRRDAAQRLQLSRHGVDRFQYPAVAGTGLMTLLGFSVASALLASSSAIMAAAPKEKAAAAGRLKPWPTSWAPVSA